LEFDYQALEPIIEEECCFGHLLTLKVAQVIRGRLRDQRIENLAELVIRLREIAFDQLSGKDLRPVLHADFEIQLSDLVPEILDQLELLQPTGYGNPQAIFVSRELKVNDHRVVGRDRTHLKLTVSDGWITYDSIAFGQGHWHEDMPVLVDLMYTFEKNEFNGKENFQLNVKDLKPSSSDY